MVGYVVCSRCSLISGRLARTTASTNGAIAAVPVGYHIVIPDVKKPAWAGLFEIVHPISLLLGGAGGGDGLTCDGGGFRPPFQLSL